MLECLGVFVLKSNLMIGDSIESLILKFYYSYSRKVLITILKHTQKILKDFKILYLIKADSKMLRFTKARTLSDPPY